MRIGNQIRLEHHHNEGSWDQVWLGRVRRGSTDCCLP
jgi:hypothetical protein